MDTGSIWLEPWRKHVFCLQNKNLLGLRINIGSLLSKDILLHDEHAYTHLYLTVADNFSAPVLFMSWNLLLYILSAPEGDSNTGTNVAKAGANYNILASSHPINAQNSFPAMWLVGWKKMLLIASKR